MNEINAITEENISFMECFYTPQCLAECLFSDGDDLTSFEEDKFLELRTGQIPLLSFEYLIDYEASGLTRKQGMELRKGAGNIYCFGGRNFGKTFAVEKLDIILSLLCLDAQQMGFSSYDFSHIRGVLLPLIDVLEHHPFVKHWKKSITASPDYVIRTLNGNQLNSVNMNVSGKNPGHQFFQKHLHKLYIEEASFETEEVNRRRIDSKHEIGCVERLSGMTNFTRFSPAGKIFYSEDPKIQTQVCNLPQFVNPNFDEAENKAAIKKHGGKLSLGYRVFVKGEIVTEAISTFDMDKVRANYNDKKEIKMMEVDKTTYQLMKEILIVEKPKNVDEVFIVADIGESAPTEILIIFKIGERYKYEYNIVLHNLDYKQQFKIFDYLAEQFGKAYFGIDCGDGTGRAVALNIEKKYGNERLVRYQGASKIAVDVETEEVDGKTIPKIRDGEPVFTHELMSDWAIHVLRNLFYGQNIEIPLDYKFIKQFTSVVSIMSGESIKYKCVLEDNHQFDAWKVFANTIWQYTFSYAEDYGDWGDQDDGWGTGV